jgi:hypothetical protein
MIAMPVSMIAMKDVWAAQKIGEHSTKCRIKKENTIGMEGKQNRLGLEMITQ